MSIEGGYVGKKGSRGHRKWVSREQEVNMMIFMPHKHFLKQSSVYS